jgi:hypothetical protein
VYFHNSTVYLAEDTQVGMSPKSSGSSTNHTFTGAVASTTIDRATGSASVRISSSQSITFIPGTIRAYIHGDNIGYTVADESALFGSGVPIGAVSPGWDTQGTITAQFKVSDTSATNDNCSINSFTANDYSITSGDSTNLNWRTTGCDYVNITSSDRDYNNQSANGSVSVSPDVSTTYTLRAYPGGESRTVRINVGQNNTACSIDNFTASPSSIDRGQSSTLRWNTSGDVDYVTISSLSGNRSADGSVSVSPYSSTTYTLRAYCTNGNTQTDTFTVNVRNNQVSTLPQAITTVATILSSSQARLNGMAVPHTTNGTTTAWFDWGVTGAFGNRTIAQTVSSGDSSQYYSDIASGLVPGGTYFYRAVVQNQNGIAYGETVRFQTTKTITTPVTVKTTTVRNVVVAQSAASLLELRVESNYDHMCVNGLMDYTISYHNISSKVLEKSVLQFNHPKEITYLTSSRGEYSLSDRTITIDLGNIQPGEQGVITIHARVNNTAVEGNLTVATATVVYTNSASHAQEDAIAYSLVTVSNDCPSVLGASVFGFGSFLPSTLLGWLLLILVILALIVLGRHLYKKNDQPA